MPERRTLLALSLLACATLLLVAAVRVAPPAGEPSRFEGEWVRFQITAVEEGPGGRKVISDAAVEGPSGTDFNVNLQDGRFKMSARFITDLAPGGGALTLRARLDTRRYYGRSETGLPLYEEDEQRQALRVGFDEAVVLLPFGGGGDAGRLSVEIEPSRVPPGGRSAPEIKIGKPSPGGAISVEATMVPHRFTAAASLHEDGREVARGAADCLLEEACELRLRPVGTAGEASPLALKLTVERYEQGPGDGRAAVRFDLLGGDGHEPLARNWAGVAGLGSELSYDVSRQYGAPGGGKYELRLRIGLARAEAR